MKYPDLPPVTGLTGAEIIALAQGNQIKRTTVDGLIALHTASTVPHPQYDVQTNLLALYNSVKLSQ